MPEEIEGTVEKLLFSDEQSGYSVMRFRTDAGTVVAVGSIVSVVPGERFLLKGEWTEHRRFGRQFKVREYHPVTPATEKGIESYLSSGMIPGIGPHLARSIVRVFGTRTMEILDHEGEKLSRIEGIGPKRLKMIRKAWKQHRGIRQIMIFLQSYGVSPALAARIYKEYGDRTTQRVQENPYRLARDIPGVGFLTADRIAVHLGLPQASIARAEAGILHTLRETVSEGHVYYPRLQLVQAAQKVLQIDRDVINRAVDTLREGGQVIVETPGDIPGGDPPVYLPMFHRAETGAAELFGKLLTGSEPGSPRGTGNIDPEKAVSWVQNRMGITLAERQVEALRTALSGNVMVITGGPGTGKTTIIRSLLAVLDRSGLTTLLTAPTGRAAKRLQETSGREAVTIHRLLEYNPNEGGFRRGRDNLLRCDFLILDETSMVDILLMYHLLKALPSGTSLVLVGDADQLPSVGAGSVLKDIILSGTVPVVELNEVFRQAEASRIVVNAHRINIGLMPLSEEEGDFYFIQQEDPGKILETIVKLCKDRIPARFHLHPVDDIQVLSPMHRGEVGVTNLNNLLQKTLNPCEEGVTLGERFYKAGDKVMQIRNNYDKDVYNGDIGRLEKVDSRNSSMTVRFENRRVRYEGRDMEELTLAYAVSVHKSQGSEFPAVIIPVITQHYMLLQRNLIYTAVTRGKKLVVLIGTKKALGMAVKNTNTRKRLTMLRHRLAAHNNDHSTGSP